MILGRRAEKAEKRFKSLTKLLIEKLKEAIVGGKFAPGERLSESTLASSLKVGTVALREALRSLEAEGFVTFRPTDEVVVSKPTREEIEDAYTIAGVLEGPGGPPCRGTGASRGNRAFEGTAPGH